MSAAHPLHPARADASSSAPPSLPADILDQAADWLVRLQSGAATDGDRAAWERWRAQSPQHASAWNRAERLLSTLGELPPALAMPALDRPTDRPARSTRRAAMAKLALLLGAAPATWAGWQWCEGPNGYKLGADHRTATGERREVLLADGSRVTLNTGSAIDVRYDTGQRLVHLRAGEILVQSHPDPSPAQRPLRVQTTHGMLQALGTRFTVRQLDARTHVAVLEGAVRITPALPGAPPAVLQTGEQASFTSDAVGAVSAADDTQAGWTQGLLLADRMRLADLAAELQRYRGGIVRCDPAVAELQVSGAYPVGSVADTERALVMLVTTYPVQARKRLRGHWLTFAPR
jgi:transmembrane sensor